MSHLTHFMLCTIPGVFHLDFNLLQDSKCEIVFGHKLIRLRGPSLQSWSCDACGHTSRNLLKPHYLCQGTYTCHNTQHINMQYICMCLECGFTCHIKCISLIGSTCISAKVRTINKLTVNDFVH